MKYDFDFRESVEYDGKIYTYVLGQAYLCSIDLLTEKIEIVDICTEPDMFVYMDKLAISSSDIWGTSIGAEYILRYNIHSKEKEVIKTCNQAEDGNILGIFIDGDNLFIYTKSKDILRYNIATKERFRDKYPFEVDELVQVKGYRQKRWFITKKSRNIYVYTPENKTWEIIYIENLGFGEVVHAEFFENTLYFLQKNGKIITYDLKKEECTEIDSAEYYFEDGCNTARICPLKDKIVLLPGTARDIILIDKKNLDVSIYNEYPSDFKYDSNRDFWWKYTDYCEYNDSYCFSCRTSEYMLLIDKKTGKFRWIKCKLDDVQFLRTQILGNDMIYEGNASLSNFISAI